MVTLAGGWYRGKSEGEETKQKGGRGRVGEETGAERRKRSVSCPSPSVVLLLARLFLCFPLLLVRDRSGRDEEKRGVKRQKERERDSSSFFWMSQAQVRRRGKDEQEVG